MKKSKKRSLFGDRRVVLVASVLLAVLAWVVVAGFVNPEGSRKLNNVKINYQSGEDNYKKHNLQIVSDQSDYSYADAILSGEASLINGFASTDITIYPDYSAVTGPGTYIVPLRADKVAPGSYSIVDYSLHNSEHSLQLNPAQTIPITFEALDTREFPVMIHSEAVTAASDFFKDVPTTSQAAVTLSGPASDIASVSEVAAILPEADDQRETYTVTVPLVMLDKNGNKLDLPRVSMSPVQNTEVTVPILEIRTIGLTADFVGMPPGFDAEWFNSLVSLSDEEMVVIGSTGAFSNLEDPYPVAEFDISSLSMGWVSDPVNIELPEGIRSYDSLRQVTVQVDTSGMAEKTLEVEEYRVVNQPANATITPLSETLTVLLMGDAAQMEGLLPENVVIQIDAFNVSAAKSGQQIIPARVLVPSADRVFALGTYPVVCNVEVS